MASHTEPGVVALDPGIREARANCVGFAFVRAGLAIDTGGHGSVAVHLHTQTFVVEVIRFLLRRSHPLHVFGLVHERAIVIGVNESVREQGRDFFDFLLGLGLIPGTLQLSDSDLVRTYDFFLGEWGRWKTALRQT